LTTRKKGGAGAAQNPPDGDRMGVLKIDQKKNWGEEREIIKRKKPGAK